MVNIPKFQLVGYMSEWTFYISFWKASLLNLLNMDMEICVCSGACWSMCICKQDC